MKEKTSGIDIDKNGKVTMNGQTFSIDDIHTITPLDEEFFVYYESRIAKQDFGPHPEKFEKLAKVRFERFTSPINEKYKALIDRWISTFGFPDRYMLNYANNIMQYQLMPISWLNGFITAVEKSLNFLDVTSGILNSHDPDGITQTPRMIICFDSMLVDNMVSKELKDRMEKLVLAIVDKYGAAFLGTMWMQKKLENGYELSDEAKEKTIRRTINRNEFPPFIREYMKNMKSGPYSDFFKKMTDRYVKEKYGNILEEMYEYCKGLSDRMQIPEDWEYSLNMGIKNSGMIQKWATNWGCKKIES